MRASHLAIVVACGALLLADARCDGRREGVLSQKIADTEAQREARGKVIAALVSQARPVDTVPVTRWFAKWDTVYLDTTPLTDTFAVRRKLGTADSTIRECRTFVTDCVTQLANRDSTIRELATDTLDLTRLLQLERQRKPSRFGCVVGGTASDRGIRPGVGCGLRF